MGNSFRSTDHINDTIDIKLRSCHSETFKDNKTAVLIGPRNAGKTTILKQFFYTQNYSAPPANRSSNSSSTPGPALERDDADHIRSNCIRTILTLTKLAGDNSQHSLLADQLHTNKCTHIRDWVRAAGIMKRVWCDDKYKRIYSQRHLYSHKPLIPDNMEHFLRKIARIFSAHYVPSKQDLLMHKTCARSLVSYDGCVEGLNGLKLIDFGDKCPFQMSVESPRATPIKSKTLSMFESVDGIIFVAALTDYGAYDAATCENQLHYALRMFEALLRLRWFSATRFALVLSKYDLFKQMLKHGVSLTECFGDQWDSAHDYRNRKLPLTMHHMARRMRSRHGIETPHEIAQLMVQFLVERDENEIALNKCAKRAAEFIQHKFVNVYERFRSEHQHPLNVDCCPNVCTNLEHMRGTLWGIRCCLYED